MVAKQTSIAQETFLLQHNLFVPRSYDYPISGLKVCVSSLELCDDPASADFFPVFGECTNSTLGQACSMYQVID